MANHSKDRSKPADESPHKPAPSVIDNLVKAMGDLGSGGAAPTYREHMPPTNHPPKDEDKSK